MEPRIRVSVVYEVGLMVITLWCGVIVGPKVTMLGPPDATRVARWPAPKALCVAGLLVVLHVVYMGMGEH